MFVEPEQAQGFLEKLGASKTSVELRKFLATQTFFLYSPDVSYGNPMNDFHAADDHGGHVSDVFRAGSDGGGDGGSDDGGDGGGSSPPGIFILRA